MRDLPSTADLPFCPSPPLPLFFFFPGDGLQDTLILIQGVGEGPNAAFRVEQFRPVKGGRSAFISSANWRRNRRSRFSRRAASRILSSETSVANRWARRRGTLPAPAPNNRGLAVARFVRQLEHVHRPRLGHQFVHLLLAVAGRFAHHQVGHFQERVAPQGVVAEGRFDQRAEIGGQVLLRSRNRFGRPAAEADRHAAGGHNQFPRRVFAEDADHRPARLLRGRGILVAVVDHAVEPGEKAIAVVILASTGHHLAFRGQFQPAEQQQNSRFCRLATCPT